MVSEGLIFHHGGAVIPKSMLVGMQGGDTLYGGSPKKRKWQDLGAES